MRGQRRVSAAVFVYFISWFSGGLAEATEFQCASGDVACLIAAIRQSNGNGEPNTIRLPAGTYELTTADSDGDGFTGLPEIIGSVSIAAADATIIQRSIANTSLFRIFRVATTGQLTLAHVTVSGGNPGQPRTGGAIHSRGRVAIANSILTKNSAGVAGAIITDGDLSLVDSVVVRNGGGIAGRIITLGDRLFLGGCIPSSEPRTTTILRTSFLNNDENPGVLSIRDDRVVTIRDSALIGNHAEFGGAISASGGGPVTIENTTISDTAGFQATAITGAALVRNSTIVNNSFGVSGVRLQNSIVAHNANGDCAGIVSLGHSLFGHATSCGTLLPSDGSDLAGRVRRFRPAGRGLLSADGRQSGD
jgi:hypothetical protein